MELSLACEANCIPSYRFYFRSAFTLMLPRYSLFLTNPELQVNTEHTMQTINMEYTRKFYISFRIHSQPSNIRTFAGFYLSLSFLMY